MMSRFVSVIALLIGGVACSSDDDDDRKKRRDSDDDDRSERRDDDAKETGGIENETSPLPDTDEGRAIQEWAEEMVPIMEQNHELEEMIANLAAQVNCGQGPLSRQSSQDVSEYCKTTNPSGGPVSAQSVAEQLETQLIPLAEDLASQLDEFDVEPAGLLRIHRDLSSSWQNRLVDWEAILDAWTDQDTEALQLALDDRSRHRREAVRNVMAVRQLMERAGFEQDL